MECCISASSNRLSGVSSRADCSYMKVSCVKSRNEFRCMPLQGGIQLLIKANHIFAIKARNLKLLEVRFPFLLPESPAILKNIKDKLTRLRESCVSLADSESRSAASRLILRANSLSTHPIKWEQSSLDFSWFSRTKTGSNFARLRVRCASCCRCS